MAIHVLLLGAHPARGPGRHRLCRLVERAWREAGAAVTVITASDGLSRRAPWSGAGRALAAVESVAGLSRPLRHAGRGVDLVHVMDPRDALWTTTLPGDVPVTVLCHDVSDLLAAIEATAERRLGPVERLRGQLVLKALQRADHLQATSQATADALHRLTGRRASVVHPPVDAALGLTLGLARSRPGGQLRPSAPRRLRAWPYLLTVGGRNPLDHREATLEAWANLRRTRTLDGASLVVVGPRLSAQEDGMVAACGGHVEVVTDVSDQQLGAFYRGAQAVLALGGPRGFPWPIIEAQSAARPVLATDAETFREAGGDGCVYLPPDVIPALDAPTWAALAHDLVAPTLAARAATNVSRFAWQPFVERLVSGALPPAPTARAALTAGGPSSRETIRSAELVSSPITMRGITGRLTLAARISRAPEPGVTPAVTPAVTRGQPAALQAAPVRPDTAAAEVPVTRRSPARRPSLSTVLRAGRRTVSVPAATGRRAPARPSSTRETAPPTGSPARG